MSPGGPRPASDDQEAAALFALVRARYGERLTEEELAEVREIVDSLVDRARVLRAIRLRNADEPAQPFAPYRADA